MSVVFNLSFFFLLFFHYLFFPCFRSIFYLIPVSPSHMTLILCFLPPWYLQPTLVCRHLEIWIFQGQVLPVCFKQMSPAWVRLQPQSFTGHTALPQERASHLLEIGESACLRCLPSQRSTTLLDTPLGNEGGKSPLVSHQGGERARSLLTLLSPACTWALWSESSHFSPEHAP